jgi:aminopeptidase N
VPSRSGMETQETVTIGAGPDPQTFLANMLHEYAHQWYGDLVTPDDWRDLWLNESFATYLQLEWMADVGATTTERWFQFVLRQDQELRDDFGPPGAYDRRQFASSNVYLCGAAMLRQLQLSLGEEAFDGLLRDWPQEHAYGSVDRAEWLAFLRSSADPEGAELALDLAREWLMSERTPAT